MKSSDSESELWARRVWVLTRLGHQSMVFRLLPEAGGGKPGRQFHFWSSCIAYVINCAQRVLQFSDALGKAKPAHS